MGAVDGWLRRCGFDAAAKFAVPDDRAGDFRRALAASPQRYYYHE
eukprot:gene28041-24439_t